MTINYYSKSNYGTEMYYFATQRDTNFWRSLTGKKTITLYEMQALSSLTGVTFKRVFEAEA